MGPIIIVRTNTEQGCSCRIVGKSILEAPRSHNNKWLPMKIELVSMYLCFQQSNHRESDISIIFAAIQYNTLMYHMSNVNAWKSMGKPCSCMWFMKSRIFYCESCENPYQYYKSHEDLYQVLQVTRAASECAMKLKVRMIITIVPSYTRKICCRWHCYSCCVLVTIQMATNL